jgi:hypothetical protein
MAKPTPNPEPKRNRADRFLPNPSNPANGSDHDTAESPSQALQGTWHGKRVATETDDTARTELPEIDQLRNENEELRMEVADLRQLLEETAAPGAGTEGDQELQALLEEKSDLKSLLEEKTELIRELHVKIQESEQQIREFEQRPVPRPAPNEKELLALSDELERERCQLDQERRLMEEERRQLKEDEQTMMTQMREMEVQMARERAEMARQRNELQRLHSEIRHEIEVAQRDGLLNERLKTLQRKHQEVSNRKGSGPDPSLETAAAPPRPVAPPPEPSRKDSSILRRFFGPK